jgi:hypothetical protein
MNVEPHKIAARASKYKTKDRRRSRDHFRGKVAIGVSKAINPTLMQRGRRLIVILATAAALVLGISFAPAQAQPQTAGASPVDKQLDGIWEAVVPAPQGGLIHMRCYINADGTFLTIFPGSALPPIGGTISASNHVYVTLTPIGSDGGSYTFTSPDQVTMAGRLGPPVTWQRVTH